MTAVAIRPESSVAVLDDKIALTLRSAAPQFAPFLPAGVDVEQVVAAVFLECQRVPALAKCSPASIVAGASRLVQMGLDIGRTGYLIPFSGSATAVPSYKGLIELILASGAARACEAREVRENDFFEYEFGSEGRLRHVPGQKNPKAPRGRITHFYVTWKIKFGEVKFDVMSIDEVEDLRLKYSKQWGKSVWARGECEAWYGIKTVIIKSAKQLPQNPKLAKFFAALHADGDTEQDITINATTTTRLDEAPDRPSAPAPAAAPEVETGEAATDKQIQLLNQLANSHHFDDKAKATMRKRADAATKEQAASMIDGATAYIKRMDDIEREEKKKQEAIAAGANPKDGLPGTDADLPF